MSSGSPSSLSTKTIAARLVPFNVTLSQGQLESIQKYISLLLHWNQIVSLTSIEDPLEIVTRHFGESMFQGKILFPRIGRLADVGSGAGFPGLALKIAFPELNVVLIEPNLKKCAFLTEVIGDLILDGVQVFRGQYEAFQEEGGEEAGKFDYVCCRALGDYKSLLSWARRVLDPDGRAILWIGEEDSILLSRTKGWVWDLPTRIPESRRRVITVGRPTPTH